MLFVRSAFLKGKGAYVEYHMCHLGGVGRFGSVAEPSALKLDQAVKTLFPCVFIRLKSRILLGNA